MTAALAAQLSKNVNQHVIVIMKSQLAAAHVGTRAAALRSDAIAAYQAPLMSELRAGARHPRQELTSSSTRSRPTVSAGEEARLKANPAVAEVIPDVTIEGAQPAAAGTATRSSKPAIDGTAGQADSARR